jgi:DedD protein
MGFFKRKDPADQAQPSKRAAVPSEVQAAELRGRARRRLAGAIALVLAAVNILPMVLDSQPTPVADTRPIKVPERNTPFQPQVSEPQAAAPATPTPGAAPADPSAVQTPPPLTSAQPQATTPPATTPPAATPPMATPPQVAATTPPRAQPATPPKPESKPEPKPATPKPETRSDDGARALALLEGRAAPAAAATPAAKPPAAKGNFVLQIAAYTTSEDAQSRRAKLHQAGVTNAFVEQASIGGKQQYRLRVGPFPSREAAQAAQARLRTLGYDNGFIAAQ